MTDVEKVVKGLECCASDLTCRNWCPYYKECMGNQLALLKDALALIKEQQEAIPVKRIDGKRNHFIKCGNCNTDLMSGMKFCPTCGKKVKWND